MLCSQMTMDQEHIEFVKQNGDGLAETIRGLDHTARHDSFIYVIVSCCAFT